MGLFHRKSLKKEESVEEQKPDLGFPLHSKTSEKENPDVLTNTEKLEAILKKLADVKEEYSTAVTNLMSVKKEFHEKKHEIDVIDAQIKQRKEELKDLLHADTKLVEVKKELSKYTADYKIRTSQLNDSELKLEKIKKQQTEAEVELVKTNETLRNLKDELRKIQAESQVRKQQSKMAKKEANYIEDELANIKESPKHLVEAASAVVATLNQKLESTEKELGIVQNLLKIEKSAHEKTRKQLEELKSKSD